MWCIKKHLVSYLQSLVSARLPPLLFLLLSGDPEDKENKRAETEMKQSLEAEWLPLPRQKWKCCDALSSRWNRKLATAVSTDPLFDQLNEQRSSSIYQHHYNYLAKVSDPAVLQNTDENTMSFPRVNTFKSFIPQKNKHQRSLCMTYYIMDIQTQCMVSIISHLPIVAVMKWWFTMPVFSITYQWGGGVHGAWWN